MTLLIVGCWQERIIVAADSLAIGNDEPELICKIYTFGSPLMVAAGRGSHVFIGALAWTCREELSTLDGTAAEMPDFFDHVNGHVARGWNALIGRANPTAADFIIGGWSDRRQSMVVHAYCQESAGSGIVSTVIEPGQAWVAPWDAAAGQRPTLDDISSDDGLASVARAQVQALWRKYPETGGAGGPLMVARLTRQRIVMEQIAELDPEKAP